MVKDAHHVAVAVLAQKRCRAISGVKEASLTVFALSLFTASLSYGPIEYICHSATV